MSSDIPFAALTPDFILQAIDELGYLTSGQLLALNSYENRVYQVGVEDSQPIIVKFYRPGRWSENAIREEHEFSHCLAENDIPVVPPLLIHDETLHQSQGYLYALYERKPGRAPDITVDSDLQQLGRLLARIHLVGKNFPFEFREKLGVKERGYLAQKFIVENNFLPDYLEDSYLTLTEELLEMVTAQFELFNTVRYQSIHGDFHLGNVLSNGEQFFIVDLDDCIRGPVAQDLWMLLSGDQNEQQQQLNKIMEGYRQFNDFDAIELNLIESLKTLRIIHYAYWLARRWHDPAFPQAFPWFDSPRYWEEHVQSLQEQLYNMKNIEQVLRID